MDSPEEARQASESARAIEAILMVAQEPVDPHLLAQLLEVAPAVIEASCQRLQAEYEAQERGFVLVKVAGGYRFQSHGDLAAYVERFALEGQSARLSSAALETLAIVAYKQPLSRAQVAAIRGVNVDGVMRTLQQRGYVEEIGRDSGPGQAALFGTSKEFLERMGLDRIEDLPPIADLFPSAEIMEALELTLRAAAPEADDQLPLDEAPADVDEPEPVADAEPVAEPEPVTDAEPAPPLVIPDDDDFPEPELPSWAVDPPVAADIDGDGQADVPPGP
ncbi:MAG: scpB [Ilumatobacteraceae bacterium]|nr:scpB [Ilumatobacteraceae bacterium]